MKIFWTVMCMLFAAILFMPGCARQAKIEPPLQTVFNKPQYSWGSISGKTIVVWGDQTELERSYLKKAFARYENLTGNIVQVKKLSKQELAQLSSKDFGLAGVERPDILLSYGGSNLDRFHPEVNFYDFTIAPWVEDLTGTAINQTIYNGKVIGLPLNESSVSGTLYNKEIFKKYGLTRPRTQVEFMEVCEKLLEKGITPVYLPYAEISMLLYQFPMDSIVENREKLDALNDGSLSYAQIPEMKKIVTWYKTMSDQGYFGKDYTSNNWSGMNDAMGSEKYAMMLCWDTWLYTDFTGDASKFGLMPAFVGVPEKGSFEGPNLAMLIANKHSPNLDVALDFIMFMSDPYNYNVIFEGIYTAPVFKNQMGSITTPQYMEAEKLIEQHFYDSTAWLRIRGFSQIDAKFIQKHMQDSGYDAEACLRDMDAARRARMAVQ